MSDLEREELTIRTMAMNEEEKRLMVKSIPSSILWDELTNRYNLEQSQLNEIRKKAGY